jgi:hypothetical protein
LLDAEALLSQEGDQQTLEQAFAAWREEVARRSSSWPPPYAQCLTHCVGVLARMQPHLFVWTTLVGLPRTNNDLERFIRAMKTRYRRMSGRKNWQAYLLRYGQRVAFFEAQCLRGETRALELHLRRVAVAQWPQARQRQRPLERRLRAQFRFTHRRADLLRSLEERWSYTLNST